MGGEYGIVCNIAGIDSYLRTGSLAWIASFNQGDLSRHKLVAMTRGGRVVEKYVPTKRLASFRVKWIPPHLQDRIYCRGTRDEMDDLIDRLVRYEGATRG